MRDLDLLGWPPRRSDLVLFVGLAIIVYAAIEKAWGVIVVGAVLMLAGLLAPRMRGPFSFGAPQLQFKGELVDPGPSSERQQDEQSARQGQPRLPAPPASSQPPGE